MLPVIPVVPGEFACMCLSDGRHLEGDRRLWEDTAVQTGTSYECNALLDQEVALRMRTCSKTMS